MTVQIIVFAVAAAIIMAGALGVVISRNPVHSALSLVATLFGVAVLFIEQNANFLAAVQVIVYAGAIVVLFLFVIMLLGVDEAENLEYDPLPGQRASAVVAGLLIAGGLTAVLLVGTITGAKSTSGALTGPVPDINKLARSVFTQYLFAFEVTSALLVIAVVGAVVLARRSAAARETVDEDDQEDEPIQETVS